MGSGSSCFSREPPPIYRGERRHRFPVAPDSYANCASIECACCGKNLRSCGCTCNLTGRCMCAGPLNYHRHDLDYCQVKILLFFLLLKTIVV